MHVRILLELQERAERTQEKLLSIYHSVCLKSVR